MNTIHQYKHVMGSSNIQILPTQTEYAKQIEHLDHSAYGVRVGQCESCLTADKVLNHLRVFPEGQIMAVDVETDTVIGFTANMRMDFNPDHRLLDSWKATTGDG
jgi:hypothetical protein